MPPSGIVTVVSGRQAATMQLDGHPMHAIVDGAWSAPGAGRHRQTCRPAQRIPDRRATAPPPLAVGSIAPGAGWTTSAQIMIERQSVKLGPCHARKPDTVIIENTHYRLLRGDETDR